jgi:hypothetical protein
VECPLLAELGHIDSHFQTDSHSDIATDSRLIPLANPPGF